MPDKSTVFLVDDDSAIRDSLRLLLESEGLPVVDFATAEEFLHHHDPEVPGCLVADLQMPGLSGLELQQHLLDNGAQRPMLILTGFGSIPDAVQAIQGGAVDFLEKPVDAQLFLSRVQAALATDHLQREQQREQQQMRQHFEALTPREFQIIARVAAGQANKVMAMELGISERTVELHRSRGMKKLQLRSVAELARYWNEIQPTAPAEIQ